MVTSGIICAYEVLSPHRRRGHGRGVSRARHAPGPRSGHQGPARRPLGGRESPPPFRAGGASGLRPQPPAHHHHSRDRVGRRARLHRDGVRPRARASMRRSPAAGCALARCCASRSRWPTRSPPRMRGASSTATSSRPT